MSSKKKTAATKEEAKPALVPKLRFPEFRGAGEWEETRLGRMGGLVSGLTYSPDDVRESGLLVLRSSNVQNGDIALDDCVYVDPSIKGANLSQPNDILICVRNGSKALIGKCALIPEGMPLCTHGAFMTVFRAHNPSFVFQLFQSDRYQKQVEGDLGATINSINGSQLLKYEFSVPKPAEQQKIAECLSSVDELMAAQGRKVDALKTHKKGLMQQLFPRDGKSQPHRRFPEFQNAGEWEETELGQCLEKVIDYRGKPPPKAESGVPLITARNVRFGCLDMNADEYIESDAYDAWMIKGIPKAGDILFTTEAPLGNVAMFPSEGKFALGQRIITLRCKTKECVPEFLFQSLLGPEMQETIDFHSTGSTAKGIKSSVFVTLSFRHPKVEEQQRIASCLSSLDALITAETQKLEALKTYKRGLMQQLFPSPEEVEE